MLGLNGTGRSPKGLTIKTLETEGINGKRIPFDSIHSVTVPGAIAGWVDAWKHNGSGNVSLAKILEPAVKLCTEGHIVSEISAHLTANCWSELLRLNDESMLNVWSSFDEPGVPPRSGSLVFNEKLGHLLKSVAEHGKDGFYKGKVADAIVNEMKERGG